MNFKIVHFEGFFNVNWIKYKKKNTEVKNLKFT